MSASQPDRMPIILLKEGATETKGKDARKNNITVKINCTGYSFQLGSERHG